MSTQISADLHFLLSMKFEGNIEEIFNAPSLYDKIAAFPMLGSTVAPLRIQFGVVKAGFFALAALYMKLQYETSCGLELKALQGVKQIARGYVESVPNDDWHEGGW